MARAHRGAVEQPGELPDPFLTSLFSQSDDWDPVTLCAGYDGGEWRCAELAKHLAEWLLEFSLRKHELEYITPATAVAAIRTAASRVFREDGRSRGEAGELLLHAGCRQEFETSQLVARLYYKSSLDEQVHGFDCVHFREVDNRVELWLGEAKIIRSADSAISKARQSIKSHLDRGFLAAQKVLIAPKISSESDELYRKVEHLLHRNTPVDRLLDALVVPVLIATDSEAVAKHDRHCDGYMLAVHDEMSSVSARLKRGEPFGSIRIQPIYVPLLSKELFRRAFGAVVKGLQ